MSKLKLATITLGLVAAATLMVGCSTSSNKTSVKSAPVTSDKAMATADAKTLLDYAYKGNTSGLESVTNQSSKDLDDMIVKQLATKQNTALGANGNINDYYLQIDGSNYYANDIINDYAKAYLNQSKLLGGYTIKSVNVSGDTAHVTASIKPIASLSEANPIGDARSKLFGGVDEDTFIRKSQNTDIKAIKQLITLKLYAIYYGDLAHNAERSGTNKDVEFTLTKKGDHFTANNDTVTEIIKNSREKVYAKTSTSK